MARILAISSQVARGHVGLSAISPALQALGHEVVALPTILLSNHPGHPHAAGERVSPMLLDRMLDALDVNDWLADIDGVITGYLPSADHVGFAVRAVARVRAASPGLVYLCDAVLGDTSKGLYIAPEAAEAMRTLVAGADIVKGNAFELGWLARAEIGDVAGVSHAAAREGWRDVVATSVRGRGEGVLGNVWIVGDEPPAIVDVAERSGVPKGTGDLMAALVLGHLPWLPQPRNAAVRADVLARAVAALQQVIEASIEHPGTTDELRLRSLWFAPEPMPSPGGTRNPERSR